MKFSGANVISLLDLSGNGNHTGVQTGPGATHLPGDLNDLGTWQWSGASRHSVSPFYSGTDPGYCACVISMDVPADTTNHLWEFGSGSSTNYPFSDNNLYQSFGTGIRYSIAQNPAGVVRSWHVLEAFSDGVSRGMRINNVNHNIAVSATPSWTGSVFRIGGGTGGFMTGRIAEMLFYSRSNMAAHADAASIRNHLNSKWGGVF